MATDVGAGAGAIKAQSQAREWFEPLIVVSIMIGSLYINRYRDFSIFSSSTRPTNYERSQSADSLLSEDDREGEGEEITEPGMRSEKTAWIGNGKKICGIPIEKLDTSRFAGHIHSRILQKFPFLIEMFYWALNYVCYTMTKKTASRMYAGSDPHEVTELAQSHALDILWLEHDSMLRWFFPLTEVGVQQFFIKNHPEIVTLFNQLYSIVHIPGTVAFLSWYYYAAPTHNAFSLVRRTLTLGNFAAFFVFAFYPCMPPRLLPASYGFQDTVRQEHAESVWTNSESVNELAAMPSLHFTYAFTIGCTFLFHSGVLQALFRRGRRGAARANAFVAAAYAIASFCYPLLVLTIIVATANHFWLDAVIATISVTLAFLCNKVWFVLQPFELALQLVLRIEKPVPSTGVHRRAKGRGRKSSVVEEQGERGS